MGVYPEVSLKMARDRRDAARRMLVDGQDPSVARQVKRQVSDTFQAIAEEWLAQRVEPASGRKALAAVTVSKTKWMLQTFIYPALGSRPLTGPGGFVFPSIRDANRPMSENTVNAGLRRLGYSGEEQTGHGFRSIASTCLNEQGFNSDLIELQLAHAERNKVRAAYNRAEGLAELRKMMQAWADYLVRCKEGTVS